jgi:hypothetical protein
MRRVILKEQATQKSDLEKYLSICPEDAAGFSLKLMTPPGESVETEVLYKLFPNQGYMIIKPDFTFSKFTLDNKLKPENGRGRIPKCKAFTGIEQAPLGEDMKKAIEQLKAKDQTLKSIDDEGVRQGLISKTFIPVDLNSLDSTIFPDKNKYFLYRQKGLGGVAANVSPQITKWLTDNNLQLDEPTDINMWKTQRPLVTALQTIPGSAAFITKIEGELGKKRNEIMVYNITNKGMEGVKSLDVFRNAITAVTEKGTTIDRQVCRTAVKALSRMSQLYNKNKSIIQQIDSSQLNTITDYVLSCDLKKFLTGALGVGDEIARLKRDSSPFGLLNKVNTAQNQANMNESVDDYLKRVLRKKLSVLSESKKKSVITTKEVRNYINIIDEAFDSLDSGKKRINEDGLKDMLSGALGYGGEGIISYFKERLAKSIIDKFVPGGSDTWLGGIISTSIGNIKIGDYLNGNIFKCEFVVKELAKGIGENAIKQFADKKGLTGGFYDVLRNSVVEVVEDVPFVESLEKGIATVLCPSLSKLKTLLGGVFGSLGSELKQEFTPTK